MNHEAEKNKQLQLGSNVSMVIHEPAVITHSLSQWRPCWGMKDINNRKTFVYGELIQLSSQSKWNETLWG